MQRKLAPGPGNWLIQKDLCNLTKFGMKGEFAHPSWMAAASKLRVSEYVIKDFANLHKSLEQVHSEYYRRPFGQWHYQSFVHILDKNARMMQSVGCSADKVRRMMPSRNALHFQRTATIMFRRCSEPHYSAECRVRQRITRWRLHGPLGTHAKNIMRSHGYLASNFC